MVSFFTSTFKEINVIIGLVQFITINEVHLYLFSFFFHWYLVKVGQMFGHTTGMHALPFHTTSITIIFMVLGRFIPYTFPIFLFYLTITPLLAVPWGFLYLRIWGITTMSTMISGNPSITMITSLSLFTSMSLGWYCIHFRKWFKSNWMRLVVSH